MVNLDLKRRGQIALVLTICTWWSTPSFGIFNQTADDLLVMEDQLRHHLESNQNARAAIFPMIIARPKHLWVESRDDFAAKAIAKVKQIAGEDGLIYCEDCDTHRLHVADDSQVHIQNGEFSVIDFQHYKDDKRFQGAKSFASVQETPSGVELRVTDLETGKILFLALADSSKSLSDARPYMNYAQEFERRRMGEALSYVFVNLGLYPASNFMFQVEWLEQWGKRNQHISGLVLSIANPLGAIGATYHYMMTGKLRRINFGGALLYEVQNLAEGEGGESFFSSLTYQVMAQFAISDTYGCFTSISNANEGGFVIGINMFNPIAMPFLL